MQVYGIITEKIHKKSQVLSSASTVRECEKDCNEERFMA